MTLAIAGAIWSSSTAMTAIISALNRAYDIQESRAWWRTHLLAVGLTITLALFVVIALALVMGAPISADGSRNRSAPATSLR